MIVDERTTDTDESVAFFVHVISGTFGIPDVGFHKWQIETFFYKRLGTNSEYLSAGLLGLFEKKESIH